MRVAVAAAPLNIANPDGDAGEFGSEFVDFQPEDVVRAGFHIHRRLKTEFLRFNMGAFFDVAQGDQGQIKKVTAAAGGVKNTVAVEAEQEGLVGGFGFFGLGGHLGFGFGPFAGERFADQRVDELGDGAGVGVVGAERGAGSGVEAALEQRAEDGGVDGAPVHIGSGAVQGLQVGYGQRGNVDVFYAPGASSAGGGIPCGK